MPKIMMPLAIFAAFGLEAILLIKLGQAIGGLPVLIEILVTALVGYAILRRAARTVSGPRLLIELLSQPGTTARREGVSLFLAGILLIVPGLLSDLLGFVILTRIRLRPDRSAQEREAESDPAIIDVDFEVQDPPRREM
jgi:UPF0716 protein FxsA